MVILRHCNQNQGSDENQAKTNAKGSVHAAVECSIYTLISYTWKTQTQQYADNKLKSGKKDHVAWFILFFLKTRFMFTVLSCS